MPQLNGRPFKLELYKQIRELYADIRERRAALLRAYYERDAFKRLFVTERARSEALEQRLQVLEGQLSELAASLGEFRADERKPVLTQVPRLVA
jgi:hypothetical protein